jgi:hypothetical protein
MPKRKRERGFSFPVTTLAGSSLPNFLSLRKDYSVDRRYYPRFIASIAVSTIFEPFRWWEDIVWKKRLESMAPVKKPIFIIGFWRSGTTLLHEMLCLSSNASYVTTYQTVFPHLLLSHSRWLKPLTRILMPSRRPFDNVDMDLDYPQEEEIAMANVQPLSFYNFMYFPKNYERFYHRDLFFESATPSQVERWKKEYRKLISKARANKKGEVFISKNPSNMSRLNILLEMFPDARFIFIYRNPYSVVESFYGFFSRVLPAIQLQSGDEDLTLSLTARLYASMIEFYYENKSKISPENLMEVRFEDLNKDPVKMIREIYKKYELKGFEADLPRMKAYLEKSSNITPNHYQISPRTVELVNKYLLDVVTRWNYEVKD